MQAKRCCSFAFVWLFALRALRSLAFATCNATPSNALHQITKLTLASVM